jgi:hypothetical protein
LRESLVSIRNLQNLEGILKTFREFAKPRRKWHLEGFYHHSMAFFA